MLSLSSNEIDAAYAQLGISREPFVARISTKARTGISGRRMHLGCAEIIDETIYRIAIADVPSVLPKDKPIQLKDIVEAGVTTTRLMNCLDNASFQRNTLIDFGDQQYGHIMCCQSFGIKSLVELVTIIDAFKETNGFAANSNKLQPPDPVSQTSANWQLLSSDEQDRAIGRLVRLLGNPVFMGTVMPIVERFEADPRGLGLAKPEAPKGPALE